MGAQVLLGIVFVLTVVARAGASAGDAPVPFMQTFYHLETPEQKVQHLRSWHPRMGAQNALSQSSALDFRSLLDLLLFPHVTDAGVLKCKELARRLAMHGSCIAEIDEPGHEMFTLVFAALCPAQQASAWAGCISGGREGRP